MLTRARAAVLVVAALSLAACGNVHPGAAAVVDGQTITMKTADDTAKVYCTLSLLQSQQPGAAAVSNLDARRQSLTALVALVVARKLVKEQGVTVEPRSYELTTTQRDQIAQAVPAGQVKDVTRAIEDSQELSAMSVALAAKASGQVPTDATQAQLASAGQAAITKAFAKNDVHFSPRFALDPSGQPTGTSGSLSAAPSLSVPSPEQLPADQRCS